MTHTHVYCADTCFILHVPVVSRHDFLKIYHQNTITFSHLRILLRSTIESKAIVLPRRTRVAEHAHAHEGLDRGAVHHSQLLLPSFSGVVAPMASDYVLPDVDFGRRNPVFLK